MNKYVLLVCASFCSFVSPYSLSTPFKGELYSLSAPKFGNSLSELNRTAVDTVDVNLNINVTNSLTLGTEVRLSLPNGEALTGVVTRTVVHPDNLGAENTVYKKMDNSDEEALSDISEAPFTVISFKDKSTGALNIIERDNKIIALELHDVTKGELYRAELDEFGRGEFKKQDIDQYVCTDFPEAPRYTIEELEAQLPEHIPSLVDLRLLESKPTSTRTLYINNWGGTLSGTAWNNTYNGGKDIVYTPYSNDSDTANFSDNDKKLMWLSWRQVAEDYAAFDINVTMSQVVYDATPINKRVQLIATRTRSFYPKRVGGVAYVGVFNQNSNYSKTGFVFVTSIDMGMASAHESGHQMGLNHDGTSTRGYYSGHGQWGPIMGAPYGKKYVQWSKGEYTDANQHQDDIAIITGVLGVLADDAGDSNLLATELPFPSKKYKGQISPEGVRGDIDTYSFKVLSPKVVNIGVESSFLAESQFQGANLAFDVVLTDSAGKIIASSASSDFKPLSTKTNKFLYAGALKADEYFLSIDGVSPDTHPSTGFVEYGNGGQYLLSIEDPNAISDLDGDGIADAVDNCPMTPNPNQINTDGRFDGGDACDSDDDDDGYSDVIENAQGSDPLDPLNIPDDLDKDFVPDSMDNDIDGDGANNGLDAFPRDASETTDTDHDGIGNNRDLDDDGDGYSDAVEKVAGTNPLNPLDKPADLDKDFIPDAVDKDIDGDGVDNDKDAFPRDRTETTDTDKDGIGNNRDSDDDNDGIIDEDDSEPLNPNVGDTLAPVFGVVKELTIEATANKTALILVKPTVTDNNLYPFTLSSDYTDPLSVGTHNIVWTAIDYANNSTVATQVIHIVDTTAPVIGDLAEVTINANGITTDISTKINVDVFDIVDGNVPFTIDTPILKSGKHRVLISAKDNSENTAQAYLNINLIPQVFLLSEEQLAPGSHYKLEIALSGEAAVYPVVVEYQTSGTTQEVTKGEVIFESGIKQYIDILNPLEDGGKLIIELTHAVNAIIANNKTILTTYKQNFAPQVDLVVQQAGLYTHVIDPTLGLVTVLADIIDKNPDDTHEITWQADGNIKDLNKDTLTRSFEFEPKDLLLEVYHLQVSVDDNNILGAITTVAQQALVIGKQSGNLSANRDTDGDGKNDKDEGYNDSDFDGIADYLDDEMDNSRLPIAEDTGLLQTLPNSRLNLGSIALSSCGFDCKNSSLTERDITEHGSARGTAVSNSLDLHYTTISHIINYQVSNLDKYEGLAAIVLPLENGQLIPQGATYRLYHPLESWGEFDFDGNNSISSAKSNSDGNCPVALSTLYVGGLNQGDNCIKFIIEDGGINDFDHQLNSTIAIVGKLVVEVENNKPVINLKSSYEVSEGAEIILDASTTQDADNDKLTYHWEQVSGVKVNLTGVEDARFSLSTPQVSKNESISLKLTVNDGSDSVMSVIKITIVDVNKATVNQTGADESGGSLGWWFILTSLLLVRRKSFKKV
jgi:hypothetical protein